MDETFEFSGYDIPIRLCLLTGGGPGNFAESSASHMRNLSAVCGLRPGLRILEIGCGIGRDAIPLSESLGEDTQYIGVDVIADSIRWCSENITRRHPNFRFVHQNIRDELHNPQGADELTAARLPVVDGWADLIILQSVFTHMLPDGMRHYLREFRRVLRPGGLVYATVFVADERTLEVARSTNLTEWNLFFGHPVGEGVWVNDPEHPTGAVAYREEVLEASASAAGLEAVGPIRRGSWSGAHPMPVDGQDVLVMQPAHAMPLGRRIIRKFMR